MLKWHLMRPPILVSSCWSGPHVPRWCNITNPTLMFRTKAQNVCTLMQAMHHHQSEMRGETISSHDLTTRVEDTLVLSHIAPRAFHYATRWPIYFYCWCRKSLTSILRTVGPRILWALVTAQAFLLAWHMPTGKVNYSTCGESCSFGWIVSCPCMSGTCGFNFQPRIVSWTDQRVGISS